MFLEPLNVSIINRNIYLIMNIQVDYNWGIHSEQNAIVNN